MSFTYRGLQATLERHIVTEAEIDQQIARLQQSNPRIAVIKDRPTQAGDEVVLDYAGFCGEEQFAGGTAQNQTLVLGSGQFIPGFEEQLLDKVCEEPVEGHLPHRVPRPRSGRQGGRVQVRHPRDPGQNRLRSGHTFAKEVGGCDTLEEMKQKLGESLQAYTDERGEMDLQDRLIRQAAETLEFAITDAQIDAELNEQMQNLSAQLAQQGLTLEMYCQFMNTTEEKLREDARPNAVASIRVQAAIETIVDLEGLTAEPEEIGQALAVIARQNRMTVEQLKPFVDAEFEAAVRRSVLTSKAMKLVRDNATVETI